MTTPGPRVGWGFDAHRLNDQPPTKLGGVVVSETFGVDATSDGDVVAHAVADALLGASVQGDIGEHFPSSDPGMDGLDSMSLLREAASMATASGYHPTHVDVTVVAQDIRVAPHRDEMRELIAEAVGIPSQVVSVKASTTDGLGFVGAGEGIACVAVVTVAPLP